MKALEMKIAIPEVNGARSISESELECRIDPNIFAGAWLEHQPTSETQEEILKLYQAAKVKGRLNAFTCMTIDPYVKNGKLMYRKGLPIRTGFSQMEWAKMLKDYNPSRNSRQMTRTEYVGRCLYLIQKLVESGYEIAEAWEAVCDNSTMIGHYFNSDNAKFIFFEPTGKREICGFCDLGNCLKFLAEDPWEKAGSFWPDACFWVAGGCYVDCGVFRPVSYMRHSYNESKTIYDYGVGMLALD